jgi:hypothetical protein
MRRTARPPQANGAPACAAANIAGESFVTLRRLHLPACALALAALAAALVLGHWGISAQAQEPDAPARAGEQERLSPEAERIARRQRLLLDRALAGLKGTRQDRGQEQGQEQGQAPQLYFVGFAGYGPQAVFKREVLAVRELFDARFGTRGRSLILVNHASTVDDIALASLANLDRALAHIGGLMDRESDVLFLFLTSHGQKDLFAIEMPGLALDPLTPADLRSMLDRSGIRNRVIVVSACHSGSFIPALADLSTLVIAAAHAERTSFGCEDRREWTYFGDAFFNRALRRERSFEAAFVRAKRTIGRWEAEQGLDRSLPQIAGGEALHVRLGAIARGRAPAAPE